MNANEARESSLEYYQSATSEIVAEMMTRIEQATSNGRFSTAYSRCGGKELHSLVRRAAKHLRGEGYHTLTEYGDIDYEADDDEIRVTVWW